MNGFVQLRRGLLEHLEDGRITSDEYAAFTVTLMKASHKTGSWKASGKALARILNWGPRKGQRALESLRRKGYVTTPTFHHYGTYEIHIPNYFHSNPKARRQNGVTTDAVTASPQTHKEKKLNPRRKLLIPRTPRAGFPSLPKTVNPDSERRQAAKSRRLAFERAGIPRDRQDEKQLRRRRQSNAFDDWMANQRAAIAPPMTEAQLKARQQELKRQAEQILRSA